MKLSRLSEKIKSVERDEWLFIIESILLILVSAGIGYFACGVLLK